MSDNEDFKAGYRGGQFHHGMDRAEYERGKGQKELEDNLAKMAGGGRPIEIPGVAFTLLLIAPMIWMIYPALGFTLWAVAVGCFLLFQALHVPMHWGFIIGFILCVLSFIPGMIFEKKASQITVYRWCRGLIRIGAPLIFIAVGVSGDNFSEMQLFIKKIEPVTMLGGLVIGGIAYLIYQWLDLIYFPVKDKIKKLQEQLNKGERPQRSMIKRMFYGFCWFIPTMTLLTILAMILARSILGQFEGQDFIKQHGPIIGGINVVIWYMLCWIGKLPGTGKYRFSKIHEKDLKQLHV